jgi:hypothetical protein
MSNSSADTGADEVVTLRYRTPKSSGGRGARRREAEAGAAPESEDARAGEVRIRIDLNAAIEWDYLVRNRRRWIDQEDLREAQAERGRTFLRGRALSSGGKGKKLTDAEFDALLADLARSPIIEVSGDVDLAAGRTPEIAAWALVPWEYLLASATGDLRASLGGPALTVIRRIANADAKPPRSEPVDTVLFVAPAPGALSTQGWIISFEAEEKLVHGSLNPRKRFMVLDDPTTADLRSAAADVRPDVVHFTGMDVHQMRRSLRRPGAGVRDRDGAVLADEGAQPTGVDARTLVEALGSDGRMPRIVSFNIYNSAAALAPAMVAAGALGAVGFQDEIDDRLAELFFGDFYLAWQQKGVTLAESFAYARSQMSRRWELMRGAGVTLWTRVPCDVAGVEGRARDVESLVAGRERDSTRLLLAERSIWQREAAAKGEELARRDLERAARNATRRTGRGAATTVSARSPADPTAIESRPRPTFRLEPLKRLNYSMLHNGRSIFDAFSIGRVPEGPPRVDVEVVLNTGAEYFPFRLSLDLVDSVHDLRDIVKLPLISSFWRTMQESTWTTLLVKATAPGPKEGAPPELLFQQTYSVNLLPLDEWRDSDEDRIWLPSFVLPRDEVVPKIIDSAQKYLLALTDDRDAGFGGYQNIDEQAEDPLEGVDLQARAIWAALAHDYGLKYINPPPSFTESSQRLRRPRDILCGARGTCIDLALLYAACLEYIEIHPVLFLIDGHAFPGYWRDESAHEEFSAIGFERPDSPARAAATLRSSRCQPCPWGFGQAFYAEVRRHLDQDSIVPIETTMLTSSGSFYTAIDEGLANLRNRGEFNGMLDVWLARKAGVTPLPIPGADQPSSTEDRS